MVPKIAEPATIAVRTGGGGLRGRRRVLAAVDFDDRMQTALGAHRAQARDLRQHFGDEGLAAKSRIDGHDQNNVAQMQDILDKLRRGSRIEHHTRLLAERADLREHAMQMGRRAWLGLHQEMIGAGIRKGGKIALRLDDHQVNVERLCGRAADRLQHDRPDGDVRNEASVHHVDMDPVGAGRIDCAHLFAESARNRQREPTAR